MSSSNSPVSFLPALLVLLVLFCTSSLPVAQGDASSASSATTTTSPSFNFHDYLLGEWDVLRTSATFSPPSFDFSPFRGRYSFTAENLTNNIVGRYYDNHTDTGEIDNRLQVYVEFSDTATGQWKTGRDDDALTALFDFSFVLHPAGLPTSVGDWHGAAESHYTLMVSAPDKFTIAVSPKRAAGTEAGAEDEEEAEGVVLYNLKKKVEPPAKTFFQQYGTYLMLAAFFVVNMYVKSRTAGGQAAAASAAPALPAAAAAKKSK